MNPRLLQVDGGMMTTYEAIPRGASRGDVIVLHDQFGLSVYIEDVVNDLSDAGYGAVAPDLYHRLGGGPGAYWLDHEGSWRASSSLTAQSIASDLRRTWQYLGERDRSAPRHVLGFCMGGIVAFYGATLCAFDSAVSFYPGVLTASRWTGVPALRDLSPQLKAPWLGIFGDEDAHVPRHEVEELAASLDSAPVKTSIATFAHAGHAFHCARRPEKYDPCAAVEAWKRMLLWFEANAREAVS